MLRNENHNEQSEKYKSAVKIITKRVTGKLEKKVMNINMTYRGLLTYMNEEKMNLTVWMLST